MKRSDQAALIRRIEAAAADDPAALERRVIGLAAAGYAFFAGLVLILLAAGALAVALLAKARLGGLAGKLLLPILVAMWACAKALFVRFPRAEGLRLSRAQAPRLFGLLDRLRRELRTPKLHEVLITLEVNASVSQRPRLGWFGWYRNSVTIGWPLLEGLSVKEFEAVMAHEMGHVSRAHGRFSAWGYRVRASFARLAEQFEAQHSLLNRPVEAFLEWWWPKLDAHTFVLSRRQELEADRAAAELAGGPSIVSALLRSAAIAESLERFWSPLFAQAGTGGPMPGDAIGQLSRFVRGLDTSPVRRQLRAVAREGTGFDDTHPALKDRAKALGVPLASEPALAAVETHAGPHYLGESHARICALLQAGWENGAALQWQAYGAFRNSQQQRLAELSARPADGLSAGEAWERCELLAALDREAEAFDAAVALLEREPECPPALLFVGSERLQRGDERGLADLAEASRLSGEARGPALAQLVAHHRRADRETQALELERQLLAHEDVLGEAAEERRYAEDDALEHHGMGAEQVASLVTALRAALPDLTEIRIARKQLRHFADEQPLYVIGFRIKVPWYRQTSTLNQQALERLVAVPLPYARYFVGLDTSRAGASRFARLEGSRVFPTPPRSRSSR